MLTKEEVQALINWDVDEVMSIIKKCKETEQEYFFKNFITPTVTWDDILEHINDAWDIEDELKFSRKTNKHNHVHYGDRWDLIVENQGEPIKNQEIKNIRQILNFIYDEDPGHPFLFVNFLDKANTMFHKDDSDNFQLVVVGGPVVWSVGNVGEERDYALMAGDLIFSPYKQPHATDVQRRASVNMNFNRRSLRQ